MRPALRTAARCLIAASALLLAAGIPSCISAPTAAYVESAPILQKRAALRQNLLEMLPVESRALPGAQEEARWLADTAYKAAAGIARVNKPVAVGWLNNYLVNSPFHIKERGLCWHYQNDLYRELRRRHLHFFRLGCCVRDQGTGSEHHGVYICPVDTEWPHVYILDAWRYHGKLKVMAEKDFQDDDWIDEYGICQFLAQTYPECHSYPVEHWARVRSDEKWDIYHVSWTMEGKNSRQGRLMYQNMRDGLSERRGKLTNY